MAPQKQSLQATLSQPTSPGWLGRHKIHRMQPTSRNATRINCAILGSGNIGTDLMVKLLRSDVLELIAMTGVDPGSAGLAKARKAGIPVHENGIEGLLKMSPHPMADCSGFWYLSAQGLRDVITSN